MKLDKYQVLSAVVEQRSLTLAANALGCTQSAVSHSLDTLERELGFPLLKRGRAGVTLTNEGEQLLPAAASCSRGKTSPSTASPPAASRSRPN